MLNHRESEGARRENWPFTEVIRSGSEDITLIASAITRLRLGPWRGTRGRAGATRGVGVSQAV
eukprot:2598529-Prymnesium_polylepis.1